MSEQSRDDWQESMEFFLECLEADERVDANAQDASDSPNKLITSEESGNVQ